MQETLFMHYNVRILNFICLFVLKVCYYSQNFLLEVQIFSFRLLQVFSLCIVNENHEEWLGQILIMEYEFISEVDSISALDAHRTYSHTVFDVCCIGSLFKPPKPIVGSLEFLRETVFRKLREMCN